MTYKIDASHEKYITITVSDVLERANLVAAISELMHHPEYLTKHSFWDLTEATMGLTLGDLTSIASALSHFKPKEKNFANKSAIVVPGQMHKAMGDVFISMAKHLPFKYRVFNDKKKAATFLCSD